jgi:hypothetical protein
MLMDHFMDYKAMWKQLSQASYELQRGTAKIEWAETPSDVAELAVISPLPNKEVGAKLKQTISKPKPKARMISPPSSQSVIYTVRLIVNRREKDSYGKTA